MQTNDLMQSRGQAYETGGQTKDEHIEDLEAQLAAVTSENERLREAVKLAHRRVSRNHIIAAQVGLEKALAAVEESHE